MVKEIASANATAHREIMNLIHEVEVRLCAKIENNAKHIESITAHCDRRERDTAADLAVREALVDKRFKNHAAETTKDIADSQLRAVAEATKPSVYRQALTGLSGYVVKLAIFAGTCFGIALAIHRLWFGG